MLHTRYISLFCSLFAFAMATATTTEPQQGMVMYNANNFYAAEDSIAVKGLTLVASADENASNLTVFNSTPPQKKNT